MAQRQMRMTPTLVAPDLARVGTVLEELMRFADTNGLHLQAHFTKGTLVVELTLDFGEIGGK